MLLHVIRQKFLFLEDLIAIEASVDFTFKMNETMKSQLFLHLESTWTLSAFEIANVDFLISVNTFLVSISCGVVRKEPRTD